MLPGYDTNLTGITCLLTEITSQDEDFIVKIRSDPELNALSGSRITKETHKAWYAAYLGRNNDIYWVIRDRKTGIPIGTTALWDIDFRSRKAHVGRTIVLQEYRPYVFDFIYSRFSFAFETLSLNKLYGEVRSYETGILNFDKKIGYKVDGFLRQDFWDGERFIDFHYISILREDFIAYKPKYKKYLQNLETLAQFRNT